MDTGFEGTGEETLALGPSNNGAAKAVAIQPDGMIVVAGDSGPNGGQVFTLVRRKPCGCADLTFGDAGVVLTGLGGNAQANSVAIAPDGKILVAGSVQPNGSSSASDREGLSRSLSFLDDTLTSMTMP